MRRNLTIVVFLLISIFPLTTIFAQEWQWAISAKGDSFDSPLALVTDSQGNLYVAGYFQSSTLKFGDIVLVNKGGEDTFLGKFSPLGEVIWVKSFGGSGSERGTSLALDSNGYLYLTGYFESSNVQFGQKRLNPIGAWDIFLSKFDPSGEIVWVKTFGTENYEEPTGLACSKSSILMTGEFSSRSITFDNYTITNQGSEGLSDIFFTKFSFDGNVQWAQGIGGNSFDRSHSIVLDYNENIYLACSFNSNMIIIGSDTLNNKGYSDVFLVKYSTDGEPLWTRYGGGRDKDFLSSMAIDSKNNIVLAGLTMSNDFKFADSLVISAESYDFFIIKFSTDGTLQWDKKIGNNSDEYVNSISIDADDYIYIGGAFASDNLNLSPSVILNNSSNNNTTDIFLSKFSPDGIPIWAISAQGNNEDRCNGITLDNSRNIYAIGHFRSRDIYFGTTDLYNMGYSNIFISKLYKTLALIDYKSRNSYQILKSNDQLIIDYPEAINNNFVTLYDSFGRIIFKLKPNYGLITIPMHSLSFGLYFLQFEDIVVKLFLP